MSRTTTHHPLEPTMSDHHDATSPDRRHFIQRITPGPLEHTAADGGVQKTWLTHLRPSRSLSRNGCAATSCQVIASALTGKPGTREQPYHVAWTLRMPVQNRRLIGCILLRMVVRGDVRITAGWPGGECRGAGRRKS